MVQSRQTFDSSKGSPMWTFVCNSKLSVSKEVLWRHMTSFEGINAELWPVAKMTAPAWIRALEPKTVQLGQRIFRSWILAFGILPIDYDDIVLEWLEQGRGFSERSTMLTQRRWHHDRWLHEEPDGTLRVEDRVAFEPRIPLTGPLFYPLFRLTFWNRHRQLTRLFGTARRTQQS